MSKFLVLESEGLEPVCPRPEQPFTEGCVMSGTESEGKKELYGPEITAVPSPVCPLFLLSCCLSGAQAQNTIRSLEGLEGLGQLTTLHLRDNQLETLDGFCSSMKCLQYLNLRWVLPALCWDQRPLHRAVLPFRSEDFLVSSEVEDGWVWVGLYHPYLCSALSCLRLQRAGLSWASQKRSASSLTLPPHLLSFIPCCNSFGSL